MSSTLNCFENAVFQFLLMSVTTKNILPYIQAQNALQSIALVMKILNHQIEKYKHCIFKSAP